MVAAIKMFLLVWLHSPAILNTTTRGPKHAHIQACSSFCRVTTYSK
jgi:hypothetical protein